MPRAASWTHNLDVAPPNELPAEAATAVVVAGWVFCDSGQTTSASIEIAGRRVDCDGFGVGRFDVYGAMASLEHRPPTVAFHSGFWCVVPIAAQPVGTHSAVVLHVTAAGGHAAELHLGEIAWARPHTPPPASRTRRLAICMATFEPDADLLDAQVSSLCAQTVTDWHCYVSDDASSPAALRDLRATIGDDERFTLLENTQRLGAVHNYGRALSLVPAGVELVALCDQDDRWYPEKLERLIAAMQPGVALAFCDARVVDATGRTLQPSFFTDRSPGDGGLADLLTANTVTGAAAVMRADVLDLGLPLLPAPATVHHDHWLALCAAALGRVAYVDEALYDYVQHGAQAVGRIAPPPHMPANVAARVRVRRRPLQWRNRWEIDYFSRTLRRRLLAVALRERLGDGADREVAAVVAEAALAPSRRRALGAAVLRAAREMLSARRVTLGDDAAGLRGLVWLRVVMRRPTGDALPSADGQEASHHVDLLTLGTQLVAAPGAGAGPSSVS